jgi:hypothetical protein
MFKRIAIAIVLLVFLTAVFAGTNEEATKILDSYNITVGGTCKFNTQGYMDDKGKIVRECFGDISPKDKDNFLLLVDDVKGQPYKIIRINITTEKQTIVWVKGAST